MTRKIFASAISLLLASGAYASIISPEQALARLEESGLKKPSTRGAGKLELSMVRNGEGGTPAVYVFNDAEAGGYYVLSADDIAYPVLGYSDNGSFTEADMTPAMEWWLEEYARQIEYATSKGISGTGFTMPSTRAGLEPIAPMVKTEWAQGAPYY
ncbi:MAG: Spi family protease inhibitor, partial [Muribaculaceae bacterium]|nr:Spi family protease inhibitor [Muribaculaceae bacterium]